MGNVGIKVDFTYLSLPVPLNDGSGQEEHGLFMFLWQYSDSPSISGEGFTVGKVDATENFWGYVNILGSDISAEKAEQINFHDNGSIINKLEVRTIGENTQIIFNNSLLHTVSRIDTQNSIGFYFANGEYKIHNLVFEEIR